VRNIPTSGNSWIALSVRPFLCRICIDCTMPGVVEDSTWTLRLSKRCFAVADAFPFISAPSYISSQSADVILSDVRAFKLKTDALHAINVLLDEFLYNILNNSGSLSTDKLRVSLLSLLPTSLGKEALLEAEVELRAYWDRTTPGAAQTAQLGDDSKTFHLQWSFEVSCRPSFPLMGRCQC
jgi:hypothetical protein